MTATITFKIQCPEDCSETQFETWLKQELGFRALDLRNPLVAYNLAKQSKTNLQIKLKK